MKTTLTLALLLLSGAAQACPVCFGKASDQGGLATGLFWGVLLLLGFTFLLLGGSVAAVVRIERSRQGAQP